MGIFRQFLIELSAHNTSVYSFLDVTFSKYKIFSRNLVYALILWRSAFGLLMGKVH